MQKSMNELLLHPIRLRIVTAMTGGNKTAKEIAETLPDIPQTTLYRHINVLLDGGLLQVVDEIPQRGTLERVLGFKTPPSLNREDLTGLSKEEYQQTFTVILTSLLQEAIHSLNNLPPDKKVDLLGEGYQFNQIQLNLSDDEYQALNQELQNLVLKAAMKKSSSKRKQRIFTYIFIPMIKKDEYESS